MSYSLYPEARLDLDHAFLYYREQAGDKVAHDFLNQFEHAMRLLEANPRMGSPSIKDCRKWRFKRFPYTVVYAVEANNDLSVVAVAHQSRHPNDWTKRKQ